MVGNKIFTVYLEEFREIDNRFVPVHKEVKVTANRVEAGDRYVTFINNFDDEVAKFRNQNVIGYVREA